MKRRVNVLLSEEAILIADESGNRSEYIEQLILSKDLGSPEPTAGGGVSRQEVLDLIKTHLAPKDTFTPSAPDPELGYPCCQKTVPCKHWAWDGMEGLWKNSLTNRTKEL